MTLMTFAFFLRRDDSSDEAGDGDGDGVSVSATALHT